jgi:DNA-binding LacI/PurR family transcriptional regulator
MRPTIKDIAERAGVSKTTVSFALNDPTRISEETYKRVMAVVNELDYIPSPVARTLTTKRLGALGLLLPQPITEAMRNPYLLEIVRGIGELCEEREFSLTMLPPVKGRVIEAARRAFVDGLITIGVGPDHEVVELLNKRRIPFVTIDGVDTDATVNVGVDDESAAYELMRHLLDLGHRHIAVISLMPETIQLRTGRFSLVRDRRLAGFRRALEEAGLELGSPDIPVTTAQSSVEGGEEAALRILAGRSSPTAIAAMADAIALGVYSACRREGLEIPRDISVAGFDDIPDAVRVRPTLTTVRQPGREKGSAAAELVVNLLDGAASEDRRSLHRRMPTTLMVRESTAAPRPARGTSDERTD